jgi:hypothetical protein
VKYDDDRTTSGIGQRGEARPNSRRSEIIRSAYRLDNHARQVHFRQPVIRED